MLLLLVQHSSVPAEFFPSILATSDNPNPIVVLTYAEEPTVDVVDRVVITQE